MTHPAAAVEEAEALALRAVAFLAARPEEFLRFVALAGTSVDAVRARIADPALMGAVLDHLLAREDLVRAFAAETGIDPEARRGGGARPPPPPPPPGAPG
ncbi:MAG: DUF3572 family protein, partial [Rhodospirillaceae bacterium]|nr:DUF3572 family protein [Rhodospirillaceae bacterium]